MIQMQKEIIEECELMLDKDLQLLMNMEML